jgi:hypothetical protein
MTPYVKLLKKKIILKRYLNVIIIFRGGGKNWFKELICHRQKFYMKGEEGSEYMSDKIKFIFKLDEDPEPIL